MEVGILTQVFPTLKSSHKPNRCGIWLMLFELGMRWHFVVQYFELPLIGR
jgi:hypothetical protein